MARKKTGNPVGAPVKYTVDLEQIKRFAALMLCDKEMYVALGVSKTWWLEKKKEMPEIEEAIEAGRGMAKRNLRSKQLSVALNGNVPMLIFLGKQYLEQKDKLEHAGDKNSPLIPQKEKLEAMTYEELTATYNEKLKD